MSEPQVDTMEKKALEVVKQCEDAKIEDMASPYFVTVKLPKDTIDELFGMYYDNAKPQIANMKGFRSGKIPKDVIIKRQGGANKFYEPVLAHLLMEIVKKQSVELCLYDNIYLDDAGDEYNLTATVYKMPEVKLLKDDFEFLKDVEMLSVDQKDVEEAVESQMQRIIAQQSVYELVNNPIELGHKVKVRIIAKHKKKRIKYKSGEFTTIISEKPMHWWQDSVVGHVVGDIVPIEFVEDDKSSKYFDKVINAEIVIKDVAEAHKPHIDKLLEVVGHPTEDAWKIDLFKRLYQQMSKGVERKVVLQVVDLILKNSEIGPIPMKWVQLNTDQRVNQMLRGQSKAPVFKRFGVDNIEDLRHKVSMQAYVEIKDDLALRIFAKMENIDTTQADWRTTTERRLIQYVRKLKGEKVREPLVVEGGSETAGSKDSIQGGAQPDSK